MNRIELRESLRALVKAPYNAAMAIAAERYSPEAGGYKPYPTNRIPPLFTAEEWADVAPTTEAKAACMREYAIRHTVEPLTKRFQLVGNEHYPLAHALEELAITSETLLSLAARLDPKQDVAVIAALEEAQAALENAVRKELAQLRNSPANPGPSRSGR